ncbi:ABC transporter protein inner membrane protein [Bordetella pertussis]|nr:ABC transporter permease [Bordetella pertussis]ETA63756.1 putative D,D-dipeptide transport system permease protein DdpC [Bordetella pertussis CHLA-11]ETH01965.1 putative D,D-dipeptide transport system permease protein DdpC [Bordetella pertussis 2250905]ETH06065.1 putative D,D-dipeptide transport system permease protein DdpC [Bordetella pertussis 2356847]ETH08308.1 putative D,D-dipeptide transport system permease protein DdpC [Bordetella pertussis 2371640]ETH12769.1 putative D,D-dipeptide tr
MEISTPIEAGRARAPLPMALVVGTLMLAAIVLVSLGAPWLAQYDFDAMDAAARMLPPSPQHWLGTDEFGRDVFSRVLYGGTTSILLGVSATALSFVVGVPLGLLAGYLRGWIDDTVMRAVDIVISVPPVMLGLLILASTDPSLWKAALAVGIIYTPIMIRLARGMTLSLANEEFITAARARGEGLAWILLREILPNALPPLVVEASLRVSFAILLGAVFSFLGLGTQPPSSDWGLMVAEARPYLERAPWVALSPGLAICLTVIAVNLMGEGLRKRLDARGEQRN